MDDTCGPLFSCPLSCPNLLDPMQGSSLPFPAYKTAQHTMGTPQILIREPTGCGGGEGQTPMPNAREADLSAEKVRFKQTPFAPPADACAPIVLGSAMLVALHCPASDVHVHTQGWRVCLGQNIVRTESLGPGGGETSQKPEGAGEDQRRDLP